MVECFVVDMRFSHSLTLDLKSGDIKLIHEDLIALEKVSELKEVSFGEQKRVYKVCVFK